MKESDKLTMKETRSFAEFHSKDEYLEAMVEDLSDWLNYLYNLQGESQLTSYNFFQHLKNGVILCKHAHVVQSLAEIYLKSAGNKGRKLPMRIGNQTLQVPLQPPKYTIVDFTKIIFLYHERDNVSNFISWCRQFNIPTSLTFETEDLVSMKNQRSVVIALLELSRIGKLFGMEVPDIIQLEQEIDDEIKETLDNGTNDTTDSASDIINNNCVDLDSEHTADLINNNVEYKERENIVIRVDLDDADNDAFSGFKQSNNSCVNGGLNVTNGNNISFGFKPRRSSANLTRQDIVPIIDNHQNFFPDDEFHNHNQLMEVTNPHRRIRKSQSIYFDTERSPDIIRIDNSDNDSNFSQTSHSNFVIPKYKTTRPIGRVKIYDNFDKINYVKEKKTREKVDLRSLDERVREILSQCQCDEIFPMKRISEGRYQWGDKKSMIFVRILRTHVMVRVGGGWNTLGAFLNKHDSCRKEKCESFKFCLPALNKKASATTDEAKSVLLPNATCPDNHHNFSQGMLTVQKSLKRNSYDCVDSRKDEILMEENNEIECRVNKENVSNSEQTENHVEQPLSQGNVAPIRMKETINHIPTKCKTASGNDSGVKLRIRKANSRIDHQHASVTTIHSPDMLRFKLDELIADRSPSAEYPIMPSVTDKVAVNLSRIPRLTFNNKK